MARKMACIAFEAILVTVLLFIPRVISDDAVPIPANKAQVSSWFHSNVKPANARKDLDPALAAAESKPPKIIRVKPDGSGNFKTITDAVKSVPDKNTERVIIYIGGGTYYEKIVVDRTKPFITFYGDPKSIPVITYNGDAHKFGTVYSATLAVECDYFQAINLIVKNTSPRPDGKRDGAQAVALRATGDKQAYYNVKVYGFQDSLCDDKGWHFYKDCYIEGTVDFIFGNAKSIYLSTEAHVVPGSNINVITAHARDNPANDVGYSFVHGTVTGSGQTSFLGRTWRSHPTVVFSYTDISDVINPKGWSNAGKAHFEKTAFFGEYNNKGPGANLAAREPFTKKLTEMEVKPFLSLSYIHGSKWLLPPASV